MPHLVLEYTNNLEMIDPEDVFLACHEIVVEIAGAKIGDCKSGAIRLDAFCIGEGNTKAAFAHLRVFLMQGRAAVVRKKVGEKLLEGLETYVSSHGKVQISVEVFELEKDFYFKKLLTK